MKNKKKCLILFVSIIIIASAFAAGIIMYNNSDMVKLKKQLDLGQKYLSEMDYEEAVVAFNRAIEIDPRSADAYFGLADAYLGLGDDESALAELEAGYEVTGDERLKERIDEMRQIQEEDIDYENLEDGNTFAALPTAEEIDEIEQIVSHVVNHMVSDGEGHYLTYDQLEAVFRPLAGKMEAWLEQNQEDPYAWRTLADIYLHLGEMETCLEIRRRAYEATGEAYLAPEDYDDGQGYKTDQYGRDAGTVFGMGDRQTCMYSEDGTTYQIYYDDFGRVSEAVTEFPDGGVVSGAARRVYEYDGVYSVTVSFYYEDEFRSSETIFYDEYGRLQERWSSEGELMQSAYTYTYDP